MLCLNLRLWKINRKDVIIIHIFHDWITSMTYDEVIRTCRVCGKVKREPWHPIEGWCRPPILPPKNK
jgi:hypothetical protein